jgi:hypothetical protein
MADPRAFISFDFDHNESGKILFVVKEKINKCNMVIVLSGKTMASATGVDKEIAMAKDQNVPVFGVYVDGAGTSNNLPTGLQRNRTLAWNWDKIADAIDQMMTEGKNK